MENSVLSDTMDLEIHPVIVAPGEGRIFHAFGEEVIIHLGGDQTGGQLTIWTEITPPGGGPPPHYHEQEHEWFYVEEGRVSFLLDGAWHELGPGGTAFMPCRSIHTFKNIGDIPSRMRVTTTPSGFEVFFARPGGPDMPRIFEISAEHGIHFVNP